VGLYRKNNKMAYKDNKADEADLSGAKAVDKLKELAEGKICLFCTYNGDTIVSRPMSTQKVDDEGNIWFLSGKESMKNMEIEKDGKVYLMYSDTGKQHYLSLAGSADILMDRALIHELWDPIAKAWFEKGENDPDVSVIRVKPTDGHYWDTKNGKLVSVIKMAMAAITGKGDDGGTEGDIKL
jgi:general stress protein 26